MSKKNRLQSILQLIENYEIDTQEEITEKLNEQGFNTSQATVSRDIKELNLIKVAGIQKKFKYIQAKNTLCQISPNIISLFKQAMQSMTVANNLIVVKTLSGNGASVGMAIDQMHFPLILGTIAGDDTLLIITKNNADAEIISKTLWTL